MTEIQQLKCPNCNGLLSAPPGATRITCQYCGADLAVDLDKQEAMLYVLQQQERSRDKERIAEERKQLYGQYMAQYADLREIDTTLRQRQIIEQTPVVKYQLKELYRRRDEVIKGLAALGNEIALRDHALNPEMPPTQLPVPARMKPPRRFPYPLRVLTVLLILLALVAIAGYALTLGRGNRTGQAGNSDPGRPAPDPTGTALAATRPPDTGYFYAKETSHSVTIFAQPFAALGGVGALGFPIAQPFIEKDPQDGKDRWVQYFEKALMEYHPELPEGNRFQLSRLGAWRLASKYPSHNLPETKLVPGLNNYKFPETGYAVNDPFLAYWHHGGEVARFGYPLSPSFEEKSDIDGKPYTVQYFERAELEYHPELGPEHNVQLTPIGSQRLKQLYPSGAPMNAATPVPDSNK